MPNQPPQPTISVKKADGTMVRMTLREFEIYKNSGVKPAGQWTNEDTSSLLDEKLDKNLTTKFGTNKPAIANMNAKPAVKPVADLNKNANELKKPFEILPKENLPPLIPLNFAKPVLHDITPAVSAPKELKTMGSKEELSVFSLADFRRLAPSVAAAESKLKEKFDIAKQESYLAFMELRSAWQKSPLYQMYIDRLIDALTQRKKLAEVFVSMNGKPDQMGIDVFKVIIEINEYVGR